MLDLPPVELAEAIRELDRDLHEAIKFIVMTSINLDSQTPGDAAQCIITASGIISKVQDAVLEIAKNSEGQTP